MHLHIAAGTYRPGRHGTANHPQAPAGEAQKPAGLSPMASTVWDALAPACVAMGTLTPADARVFGTLCELQASLDLITRQKDGRALLSLRQDPGDEKLVVVVDAVLKAERDTAAALRPFYSVFGLDPVSRARVQVPPTVKPASKWAGLL
ncbi:MAG: P27 family phage terminase small subunit [Acidobacteriota bacterium]|nr:P27 family phage terminase small subunit [Acidobacteriota bacterium]